MAFKLLLEARTNQCPHFVLVLDGCGMTGTDRLFRMRFALLYVSPIVVAHPTANQADCQIVDGFRRLPISHRM